MKLGTRSPRAALGGALALLLLAAAPAAAQVQPVQPAPDTARAAPRGPVPAPAPADTVGGVSPGGAFLRSLVLPGWGQSAVGAPGRGAVYFALEAGSLWMVYKTQRKLQYARRRQAYLREVGELEEDRQLGLVSAREEQMEDWITLAGFLLLFNAADAFVAAHLADFDERIGVVPGRTGGAEVRVTLPAGRRR